MSTSIPREIIRPGTRLHRLAENATEGDTVVVHSRGRFRVALVEKAGPKRCTVVYGTPSGTALTRKAVPWAEVYVHGTPARDEAEAGVIAATGTDRTYRRGHRAGGHVLVPA